MYRVLKLMIVLFITSLLGSCSSVYDLFPLEYFRMDGQSYPDGGYAAPPGSWVTLRWSVYSDVVYISAGDEILGPLPSRGAVETCPLSGSNSYTLYKGGTPGNETGTLGVYVWVPPSTHYPAYNTNTYTDTWPCWHVLEMTQTPPTP